MWWRRAAGAAMVAVLAWGTYVALGAIARPAGSQAAPSLPGLSGPASALLQPAGTVGAGLLVQPMAIAAAADGSLYVADAGLGQVVVFDAGGAPLRTIGRLWPGAEAEPDAGALVYPVGLALDDAGRLYVADLTARRIVTFTTEGEALGTFLPQPSSPAVTRGEGEPVVPLSPRSVGEGSGVRAEGARREGDPTPPIGIPAGLFYRHGRLYVPDLERHVVHVLGQDGRPARSPLGDPAGAGGATILRYPNFVYVDAAGAAYVADSNNDRVCLFGPDGTLQRIYSLRPAAGAPGAAVAQSTKVSVGLGAASGAGVGAGRGAGAADVVPSAVGFLPRGLAVDDRGLLHVAGALGHRVAVFDSQGEVRFTYGEAAPAPGLRLPNGLAAAGPRLFVADRGNRRVAVWEYVKVPILEEVRPPRGR